MSSNIGLLQELLAFLKEEKKWWLVPIFIVLIMLSILLVFGESSALAPFIYPLF